MSRITEFLEKLKIFINETLSKIENSSAYENALEKFDDLDPKHQHWIAAGSRLMIILIFSYFAVSPLLNLWTHKSILAEQRTLLTDVKSFNEKLETQPRPSPPPQDWQALPADSSDAAMASMKGFIESMGIPNGSYNMLSSSNGSLQLEIPQINLRQAQALTYQVDGWYPKVISQILTIKTHPDDKQKLQLAMTLRHQSGSPFSSTSGYSSPGPQNNSSPPNNSSSGRTEPRNIVAPPPDSYDTSSNNSDPSSDFVEEAPAFDDGPNDSESYIDEDNLPPPPIGDEDF